MKIARASGPLLALPLLLLAVEAPAYTLQVDATALTNTFFVLTRVFPTAFSTGNVDGTVVRTFELDEGTYIFQPGSGMVMSCPLFVTAAGTWTYDAGCEGFLSGAGSTRLTVDGYPVNIDATGLSSTGIFMGNLLGATNLDSTSVIPIRLVPVPNEYIVLNGSGSIGNFSFGIDTSGHFTFDAAYDAFLAGRGTDTLVIRGYPVEVDATALGAGDFFIFGLFMNSGRALSSIQTLRMVPTSYEFFTVAAGGIRFLWILREDGTVDYDPSFDLCVSGRGTSRLTVLCDPGSPPTPEDLITALQRFLEGVPDSSWRRSSGHLRRAFINKLDAVLAQLAAARAESDPALQDTLFRDAIDKLRNDLLPKTDGCATTGAPDANDWIADCPTQAAVSSEINRIIMAITALI